MRRAECDAVCAVQVGWRPVIARMERDRSLEGEVKEARPELRMRRRCREDEHAGQHDERGDGDGEEAGGEERAEPLHEPLGKHIAELRSYLSRRC